MQCTLQPYVFEAATLCIQAATPRIQVPALPRALPAC